MASNVIISEIWKKKEGIKWGFRFFRPHRIKIPRRNKAPRHRPQQVSPPQPAKMVVAPPILHRNMPPENWVVHD